MKKIIACLLTLCMAATMIVFDGGHGIDNAAAEAVAATLTPAPG
jgi:hypothetical protein